MCLGCWVCDIIVDLVVLGLLVELYYISVCFGCSGRVDLRRHGCLGIVTRSLYRISHCLGLLAVLEIPSTKRVS